MGYRGIYSTGDLTNQIFTNSVPDKKFFPGFRQSHTYGLYWLYTPSNDIVRNN